MADMFPPTIADQLGELKRELEIRKHAYPGFIASGRLTPARAERQNERLRAAIATLEGLAR